MEWVVGENPNDLVLVSAGVKGDSQPVYSDQQMLEAKQRLLDLVSHFKLLSMFVVRDFLLPVYQSSCGLCNVFHFTEEILLWPRRG